MQVCNTYKNKYFSILGDSLSTLWGYSVPAFTFPFCRGGIHLENIARRSRRAQKSTNAA